MTHSSGVQRTLKFVRYLRDAGWESVVLSAHPRAYVTAGDEQIGDIPEGMVVHRAQAWDAARQLSIAGRFPGFLANPDRWASWQLSAVLQGRRLIRKHGCQAVFSTYPIATAHMIGWRLARWSGLPWIADCRDSLFDDGYPEQPHKRAVHVALDRRMAYACRRAIFTTQATRRMYCDRYPDIDERRWQVIPNGFDERDFAAIESGPVGAAEGKPKVLLHSGVLYPVERDPLPFFGALRALKESGAVDSSSLRIRLRATAHDRHYLPILEQMAIADIVELAPPLPYAEALREMANVDGLLLFQASGCNHQVPAKLYEYLRAQRPIIALTDSVGDTAAVLREAGAANLLPLADADVLQTQLPDMLKRLERNELAVAPADVVSRYSREYGAKQLADILDQVTAQ